MNKLHRTTDLKKTFPKPDTTNWSYKLYKLTEFFNDAIPTHQIDNLPDRYNEGLLKLTELTLKQNNDVMKKLNLS